MSHDFWSIILIVGLTGWLSSCIILMFRAFPERGICNVSSATRWGAGALFSFAVWIVGLLNA